MRHAIATDRTMLGERFITCTCGEVAQGPVYGDIADRNFAYHVKTASAPLRTAVVRRALTWPSDRPRQPELHTVQAYLPSNYSASYSFDNETIIIVGHDNAGWTLDGYVIPRLASGLITAREVTSD